MLLSSLREAAIRKDMPSALPWSAESLICAAAAGVTVIIVLSFFWLCFMASGKVYEPLRPGVIPGVALMCVVCQQVLIHVSIRFTVDAHTAFYMKGKLYIIPDIIKA